MGDNDDTHDIAKPNRRGDDTIWNRDTINVAVKNSRYYLREEKPGQLV